MEDNNKKEKTSVKYQYIDVSEPQEIRTEKELVAEARSEYRKMMIKKYRIFIFIGIGVILVGLAIFLANMYHSNTNPWSRLMKASTKNFEAPFKFEMTVSENDEVQMQYSGVVDADRSSQHIKAQYDAQYKDYGYSAAMDANGKTYTYGVLYDNKWHLFDCEEKVHDFFEFDTEFRKGNLNTGAFLRFAGLNTTYSSVELRKFINKVTGRLGSNSELAAVTSEEKDGITTCRYDISLSVLMDLIEKEGAPVFYRSADYDAFKKRYAASSERIKKAACTLIYTTDSDGHLTSLDLELSFDGEKYSISLGFSDFGSASAQLPEDFLKEVEKQNEAEKPSETE